jgi:starvation-inducible outer membrane lipoprotein
MRPQTSSLLRPLLLTIALGTTLPALAQTAPAATPPPESTPLPAGQEKAIERITHEDALSRIDEVRVGGQTRSIAVQPKNGAPAYEVAPLPAADTATEGQGGSSGRSRWRVLSF